MRLFVGNLSWDCKDSDLKDIFSEVGVVTSAKHMMDRESGKARGFGFVEMSDADGQRAIEKLNGVEYMGRKINVNEARAREERPRQQGRSW